MIRPALYLLAGGVPTALGQAGNDPWHSCSDVGVKSTLAEAACCAGDAGGGHRRSLQQCELPTTCAGVACATAFTDFFEPCEAQLREGLDAAEFDSFTHFNDGCRQILPKQVSPSEDSGQRRGHDLFC